jgi:hypothetical protein
LAAATAADLIVLDHREIPSQQILHNRPDLGAFHIIIDVDANLSETHERAHSDAPNNQRIHLVLGQKVYGYHASPLDMFLVREGGYLFDLAVFHIHQRKHITMPKMS